MSFYNICPIAHFCCPPHPIGLEEASLPSSRTTSSVIDLTIKFFSKSLLIRSFNIFFITYRSSTKYRKLYLVLLTPSSPIGGLFRFTVPSSRVKDSFAFSQHTKMLTAVESYHVPASYKCLLMTTA